MKNKYLGIAALAFSTMLLSGCSKEDLEDLIPHYPKDGDKPGMMTWDVINFEQYDTGFITQAQSAMGTGPVMIMNKRRMKDGGWDTGNFAMVFDTNNPTGDDNDLYTGKGHPDKADLGKALIINMDMNSTPNDNEYGGSMTLDFSKQGGVTVKDITIVDVDAYEDESFVRLYGANHTLLMEKKIPTKGNNSVQVVDLGGTKGVMHLEVVLAGMNNGMPAGSGAIDNIRFAK